MVSVNLNATPVNQVQADLNALAAAEKAHDQNAIAAAENTLENDVNTLSSPLQSCEAQEKLLVLEVDYNMHASSGEITTDENAFLNNFKS